MIKPIIKVDQKFHVNKIAEFHRRLKCTRKKNPKSNLRAKYQNTSFLFTVIKFFAPFPSLPSLNIIIYYLSSSGAQQFRENIPPSVRARLHGALSLKWLCVCRCFVPLPSSSFLHYPGYVGPDLCPVASDFTWRR